MLSMIRSPTSGGASATSDFDTSHVMAPKSDVKRFISKKLAIFCAKLPVNEKKVRYLHLQKSPEGLMMALCF